MCSTYHYYTGFLRLAPDIMSILDKRIDDFLTDDLNLVWMGWDDRLGDGWCSDEVGCGREAHLTFAALMVRACQDFGRSMSFIPGKESISQHYHDTAHRLGVKLRQVPEWPLGFGVHAATNVFNAGDLIASTQEDRDALVKNTMNDSVTICSLSNFNQYWILQGLGNANLMEHALATIKLCWGTQLALGMHARAGM